MNMIKKGKDAIRKVTTVFRNQTSIKRLYGNIFKESGYSKVYLASWNNGLYFGTMKGWINEVEKYNDDFIWKLIYEEAPNNVREFGLQFLSLYDNKKKIGWFI
ncbi:hypothetical protein RhiirB3_456947 [Rhizophagus irregularis]|nr:hypothetical protein RhiirB3_456947 [Rhizophagus irregularis]